MDIFENDQICCLVLKENACAIGVYIQLVNEMQALLMHLCEKTLWEMCIVSRDVLLGLSVFQLQADQQ